MCRPGEKLEADAPPGCIVGREIERRPVARPHQAAGAEGCRSHARRKASTSAAPAPGPGAVQEPGELAGDVGQARQLGDIAAAHGSNGRRQCRAWHNGRARCESAGCRPAKCVTSGISSRFWTRMSSKRPACASACQPRSNRASSIQAMVRLSSALTGRTPLSRPVKLQRRESPPRSPASAARPSRRCRRSRKTSAPRAR